MHRPLPQIVLALLAFMWMCSGCSSYPSPTSPTSPTPPTPGPSATYSLSGVVVGETDAGLTPLEGVRVESGDLRVYVGGLRLFAMTDKDGFYSMSGLSAGSNSIRVIKFAYEIDTRNVTINGDTRHDIQLRPQPTFTLSGVVSEMTPTGQVPVADVTVYCDSCGDGGHSWSYTDANGFYNFPAVYAGTTPLLVRKAGYGLVDRPATYPDGTTSINANVSGNTRFDIELVRR